MLRRRVFGGDRVVGQRKEYTVTGLPSSFDFYADCYDYYQYNSRLNIYYADFGYDGSIDAEVDVKIDIYDVYQSGKEQFVRSEYSTITCDECSSVFTLEYTGYSESCEMRQGYITLYSSEEDAELELEFTGSGDADDISEEDIDDIQDAVVFNIEVDNSDRWEIGKSDISVNDGEAHVSVY